VARLDFWRPAVVNGQTASARHHEDGHAVARFAAGFRVGPTVVQQKFERREGLLCATTAGMSCAPRAEPLPDVVEIPSKFDEAEILRSLDADEDRVMCWQDLMPLAIMVCAGHAAERGNFASKKTYQCLRDLQRPGYV
jgi:hypothetical protein